MCLKAHQQSLQIFNYKVAQGVLQHLLRGCLNLQCPLSGVSSSFLSITESEHTTGNTAVTAASHSSQSCCDLPAWLTLVMGNVPKRQCFCKSHFLLCARVAAGEALLPLHGFNGTSSAYTTIHMNALQSSWTDHQNISVQQGRNAVSTAHTASFCWFLLCKKTFVSMTVKILHIGHRGSCLKREFVSFQCLVDVTPWVLTVLGQNPA